MTDADKAYAEAERLIEDARELGLRTLSFDRDITHALTELPPSVATLSSLERLVLDHTGVADLAPLSSLPCLEELWLNGTRVSDLSPLSGMTSLAKLWLNHTEVSDVVPLSGLTGLSGLSLDMTQVSDLRPLTRLTQLVDSPGVLGLRFEGCAAALNDSKIAQIAKIGHNRYRARALFDYLEDWVPPGVGDAPELDELVPVERSDERLEIAATTPSEAEVEERLKQVLYEQMREKAADLARAAGNRFPKLAARARLLQVQLEPEFEKTDLLSLHLAAEDLRTLHDLGAEEEGDPFPEEVTIPLTDVINRGPGVTLGNPLVDTLVERANRRRAADPEPEAVQQAQDAMSEAVAGDEAAIGDRLRALEAQVLGGASAEAEEVQRAANRNILWRIAATLASDARGATVGVFIGALGPSIGPFVQANLSILAEAAATYGPSFQGWFMGVMSQVQDLTRAVEAYRKTRGKGS